MNKIPEIKKKVHAFLVGEEGKISKEKIVKAALILGGLSIGLAKISKADEDIQTHANCGSGCDPGPYILSKLDTPGSPTIGVANGNGTDKIIATHIHHANHSQHSSCDPLF